MARWIRTRQRSAVPGSPRSSTGQRAHWDAVPGARRADALAAGAERLEAARDSDGTFTLTQQVRLTVGVRPVVSPRGT